MNKLSSVGEEVCALAGARVGGIAGARVGDLVGARVGDLVGARVGDLIGAAIGDTVVAGQSPRQMVTSASLELSMARTFTLSVIPDPSKLPIW